MQVSVGLLDKNGRPYKIVPVDRDVIAEATVVTHEGKLYGYKRMVTLRVVEFQECDPPVEI